MLCKLKVLLVAAGLAATSALVVASTSPETVEVTEVTDTAALKDAVIAALAASWLHYGCIQLGNNCYDVFEDNKGNLWVCDECFTTQKPNPGKCRKLTQNEIANAAWCA